MFVKIIRTSYLLCHVFLVCNEPLKQSINIIVHTKLPNLHPWNRVKNRKSKFWKIRLLQEFNDHTRKFRIRIIIFKRIKSFFNLFKINILVFPNFLILLDVPHKSVLSIEQLNGLRNTEIYITLVRQRYKFFEKI